MLERIDHMVCVVPDLGAGAAPYERLGLVLTPEARHAETGAANRAIFVGVAAENACYLELLSVFDEAQARASGREDYIVAGARGGGMIGLAFGVSDIHVVASRLAVRGYEALVQEIHRPDGSKVCDVAAVEVGQALPFRVSLIQYPETWPARFQRSAEAGRFNHELPLKRLDHLAVVAPDLEAATRFWADAFEAEVAGEITTPALVIKQLRIGDAVLELLGPGSPDSPFVGRPAALASMAAWEVSGPLDDAIAIARERGFTVPDAEFGVIPGTRRATIPASELGGVGMQLIEYV